MNLPLENKFALVTGASGGIGSAVAKRLAQDGASVLVHYGASREEAEAVVLAIKNAGGARPRWSARTSAATKARRR